MPDLDANLRDIERRRPTGHRPRAVGLHIYSGAWTTGFAENFDVLGQWEELDAATATARANLAKMGIKHVLADGPEDWPYEDLPDDLELLFANPPCAVWSQVGAGLGLADPRLEYTRHAMDAALRVEPAFFVLESVPNAFTKGREVYDAYAEQFLRRGYGVTYWLTNALLHGAPQSRERFHFIAHKYDLPLREPALTARDVMTVREAIGDIADTAVALGEVPSLPNHFVRRSFNERQALVLPYLVAGPGRWEAAHKAALADGVVVSSKARMITRRLRWDTPCETLLDADAFVHPDQDRSITFREAARLCSYPDWFEFSPKAHRSEISQAVLPVIGRHLGEVFTRALDNPKAVGDRGIVEVVDYRPLGRVFRPLVYTRDERALVNG